MELFDKIWKGKPVEQCHYIEPEISYTESWGCPFLTSIDYREGARRNITENAVGAFRFGGDEFVVLYPLENKETADEIINRLNKRFDNEGIQVSIGTCVMDAEKKKSLQEYLDMADQSMYENKKSKRAGRHRDRT